MGDFPVVEGTIDVAFAKSLVTNEFDLAFCPSNGTTRAVFYNGLETIRLGL